MATKKLKGQRDRWTNGSLRPVTLLVQKIVTHSSVSQNDAQNVQIFAQCATVTHAFLSMPVTAEEELNKF